MTITNTVATPAVAGAAAPFMMIDLQALTCVLNVDINWYDSSAVNPAAVYFNTRLYELFVGFPFKFLGTQATRTTRSPSTTLVVPTY